MKNKASKNDRSDPLDETLNDCNDDVAFDDADVAAMMGFSGGFGSKKKQRREEKKKEEKSVIGEGRRAEKANDVDERNRSRDAASNSKRRENVVVDEYGKRDDNDDNDNNKKNNTTEEEENDDDDDDNESDEYEKLPISDEVELGNPHKLRNYHSWLNARDPGSSPALETEWLNCTILTECGKICTRLERLNQTKGTRCIRLTGRRVETRLSSLLARIKRKFSTEMEESSANSRAVTCTFWTAKTREDTRIT